MKSVDVVPGSRVAAISLWEPWATLMAIGAKKNETRSWPTRHRGALLICAAQRKNRRELDELYQDTTFWAALKGARLSYGHAVALVDVDGCLATGRDSSAGPYGQDGFLFGDYSPGRYAWITTGLRRLKPFPVKGKQGLFYATMPDFEEL